MKTVFKRLICSVLMVLMLISAVPASLVSAFDFDFDNIDWDVIGGIFGLDEEQIEDLKDIVENLDEEELEDIIEDAKNESLLDPDPAVEYYVAVIGNTTKYYAKLSEAIANASKTDVIFVMDDKGFDAPVATPCQIIFDKTVDVSKLVLAQNYALVKGSYVFGSTTYDLYMVSNLKNALYDAAAGLDASNKAYDVTMSGSNDAYTMTVTLSVADARALLNGVRGTVDDVASAIMPVFPLMQNLCVEGFELYDGEHFEMSALDALVSDLLSKQNPTGIYQMAYNNTNTLYTFPVTMEYGTGYKAAVNVVVKVDATASQMSTIKAAMRKTYARLYIADDGNGTYTVNANATGFFAALAEEAGLGKYYDLATEDGIRACLDKLEVEWVCERILAYNGSAYADVADMLKGAVTRFMATGEYETAKNKTLGDIYAGNGVYKFTVDGKADYSRVLKMVAERTAAFGYDYAKLREMCKNDTTIFRTVNFNVTAYNTTLAQSASDVVEGVLDAMDGVSEDTAYVIQREYDANGVLSGINFVLQPGQATELLDVVNRNNVFDALASLVPVALVFDYAAINGYTIYDLDDSISIRNALVGVYNSNPITFASIANMEGNVLATYDLQLGYGDVALNLPVSFTIACSDANLAKLKSAAAKLADMVTVKAGVTSVGNVHSADLEITVDVTDYVDTLLAMVLPSAMAESYAAVREELHAMTVNQLLDKVTLANLRTAADQLGYAAQFEAYVNKIANYFNLNLDGSEDIDSLVNLLDSNKYFQIYVKARLQKLYDMADVNSMLNTFVGDFYDTGIYSATVGDGVAPIAVDKYVDRVLNRLLATDTSAKLNKALTAFGFSNLESLANRMKNKFASLYDASFDVDVTVNLVVFDVYTVTFVDDEGNFIEEQKVVAGDGATDPDWHGGWDYYDYDVDYDVVMSDLTVVLTPLHELDGGVQVKDPTCGEEGEILYSCTIPGCDYTETEIIPTEDHDMILVEHVDADCENPGYTIYACSFLCGHVEVVHIDALGHDWDGGVVTKPATHTQAGEKLYTCSRCGDTKTEDIPPLGDHEYTSVYTAPTCTEDGYTTYNCPCGASYVDVDTGSALGHDYHRVETVAPDCENTGMVEEVCSRCGDHFFVEEIPALGHAWDSGVIIKNPTCCEEGVILYTCLRCGETFVDKIPTVDHYWLVLDHAEPDCDSQGYTIYVCGYLCGEIEIVYTDSLGHVWDEGVQTKAPTHMEAGEILYTCTVCGDTRTEDIPPLGDDHTYVEVYTEPDCYNDGYWTYTCECGASYTKQDTGSKLEHDYENVETVAPDCENPGIIESVCKLCGNHFEIDTLDPLGHKWDDGVIVKNPTCCEEGETLYTCLVCGDTRTESIPVDVTLHIWDDGIIMQLPTCTDIGVKLYTCLVCGEFKLENIPAWGHAWDLDNGEYFEPTCDTDAYYVFTCSNCSETKTVYAYGTAGHSYDYANGVFVAPTCATEGSWTFYCVGAGCDATHVIIIDKLAQHVWADAELTKAPTCTEDGELTYYCYFCGETKTEAIEANGAHAWVDVHEEGTNCCDPTVDKKVCAVCGEETDVVTTPVYAPTVKEDAENLHFISNILVVSTNSLTVGEFKAMFTTSVTVYDQKGNVMADDAFVGTECTFVCEACDTEFAIAVIGDINGDGKLNTIDYVLSKRHVMRTLVLEGAKLAAADVNVDCKVNVLDYALLKGHVMFIYDLYEKAPNWDEVEFLIVKFESPVN